MGLKGDGDIPFLKWGDGYSDPELLVLKSWIFYKYSLVPTFS